MEQPGQPKLWYDSVDEATSYDVAFLGGNKVVGSQLRPEMTAEKAQQWLANCLNPERAEKLHVDQYMFIWKAAKQKGSLVGLSHVNRECECADPQPVEPEDQRAQLIKAFNSSVQALGAITDQLDRLGVSVDLKVAK